MSWIDQGRQEHGWSGHGAAPEKLDIEVDASIFGPAGLTSRIAATAYGAVAALPASMRRRASAQLDGEGLARLSVCPRTKRAKSMTSHRPP